MVPRYSIDFTWRDLMGAVRAPRQAADAGQPALWRGLGFDRHRVAWTRDGRTALRLLLRAEQIRPREPVVVPRLTCEQVHRAIISEGGRLCSVDIRTDEFAPTAADYAVAQAESGARFVVAISYWGMPLDIPALRASLPDPVRIIHDCALSFGSWQHGVHDGVSADAAFFSFGPGKPLCLGLGGALVWRSSAFPELERRLREGLMFPCPDRLANRALLRTLVKAMFFKGGLSYRLARSALGREAKRGRILTRDNSRLVSGPTWIGGCAEAKWRAVEAGTGVRKARLERVRGLLAGSGCRFPPPESRGVWNHWICPFLLPGDSPATAVAAHLARAGFETRSPYTGELTQDALHGFDCKRLPNWLVTPSLDLLQNEKLDRFAAALKEALKHGQ
jgi:hypothetical protein